MGKGDHISAGGLKIGAHFRVSRAAAQTTTGEAAEYLGARRIPGNSVTNFLPVWRMETTATPAKSSLAASCTASPTS